VKLTHIFSLKDREFKTFSVYHAKKKNSQQRLDAFCAYCEGIRSDAIYLPNYGDDIQAMVQKYVPRVRTHNQNMTVAARAIADRKTFGQRS
jgi:hypothetical protein